MNHLYPLSVADRRTRALAALEVLLFLGFAVAVMTMPLWVTSLMDVGFRDFVLTQGARDLLLVTAIYYLLRRGGEGPAAIGWRLRGARREVLVGVWLFLPFYLTVALLEQALAASGVPAADGQPSFLLPRGTADYLLAGLFLVVVAVAEETIFRGYLLRRLAAVFGSRWGAAALSSLLFALGHAYQGLAGVLAIWAIGLFLCYLALRRGSLVAPAVIHFFQNFSGVVLLPLLWPDLVNP